MPKSEKMLDMTEVKKDTQGDGQRQTQKAAAQGSPRVGAALEQPREVSVIIDI